MKISIIVPFYKQVENIKLILKALEHQSHKDFEVILADDDFYDPTKEDILKLMKSSPLDITYIRQLEDIGFTKTKILNKSIAVAKGELFVFLDGDCIPHKNFILQYSNAAAIDKLFFGRRVYLSQKITIRLYESGNIKLLNYYNLVLSGSKKVKEGIYFPYVQRNVVRTLVGCNMAISKKNLLEVNGFDEDFLTAGCGEDVDIAWRLYKIGVRPQSVKNKSIVYHLFHKRGYSAEEERQSNIMMDKKELEGLTYCKNGLDKYLGNGFANDYPEVYRT